MVEDFYKFDFPNFGSKRIPTKISYKSGLPKYASDESFFFFFVSIFPLHCKF